MTTISPDLTGERKHDMYASRRQRGFTLTEVMVATAIFTLIFLAALLMYDRNNRVFKAGVEASEVQQNTRVAFDRLVSDLRMEGYDYNRAGTPSGSDPATGANYMPQPDEQIEYMGDAAITFRANFNYTSDPDNGRETAYEPTDHTFPVVTTANQEIVTYALKSADATKNVQAITFYADVSKPRSVYPAASGTKKERQVVLNGFDLTNANPPYTLYRITLRDASLADSDPDPIGTITPIANNIRSMVFHYYTDQGGNTEVLPVYGAGQYDATQPGVNVAERLTRSSVQSIRVQLIGMNEAQDAAYTNTETVAALQHFREYSLSSLIVPRNVGKKGLKEESLVGPGKPVLQSICWGVCGVPFLTWQAPSTGTVDFYSILYDTDPAGTFAGGFSVGNVTQAYFPIPLNPGTTYYFKVQASNGYGQSISDDMASAIPAASATPNAPSNFTVAAGVNLATLTWKIPTQYSAATNTLTCTTPAGASTTGYVTPAIAPQQHIAYRVYRFEDTGSGGTNFQPPSQGVLIASETLGNQPYIDTAGNATLVDYIPGCTNFYYRIQAVSTDCVSDPSYNSPNNVNVSLSAFAPDLANPAATIQPGGQATATAKPLQPTGLVVTRDPSCPNAASTLGPNVTCNMQLTFNKVTGDTNTPSQPLKINNYTVTRTPVAPAAGTPVTLTVPSNVWSSSGTTITVPDPGVALTNAKGISIQYQYSVVANSCAFSSTAATINEPACYFTTASPAVTSSSTAGTGTYGDPYQAATGDTVQINAPGMTWGQAILRDAGGNPLQTFNAGSSPFVISWTGAFTPNALYSIDYQVKNAAGCFYTETAWIIDSPGVCVYTNAPTGVPNPSQMTNGQSQTQAWQLKIGDSISFTKSDLQDIQYTITDLATNLPVSSGTNTASGGKAVLTWPTLTNSKTYRVDVTVESTQPCQVTQTYFVTQVCPGYSGGAPVYTTSDTNATHTGLTQSLAWQIGNGGTITVTEGAMKELLVTVLDLTAGVTYPQVTYPATGTVTVTWPPPGVTGTLNHMYQVNFTLVDSAGCSSVQPVHFVRQFCPYNGVGAVTGVPKALSTTGGGSGLSQTSPALMVPNVDLVQVTESSALAAIYVSYVDVSSNTIVLTRKFTGSNPISFPNPFISGGNNKVYRLDMTLEDTNGCQTTVLTKFWIKQIACTIKAKASSIDPSVETITNPTNKTTKITITATNLNPQNLTLTGVQLTFTNSNNLGTSGNTQNLLTTAVFPAVAGTSVNVNVNSGPVTITAPAGQTIPASGTYSFALNFNWKFSTDVLKTICLHYDTTNSSPPPTSQSCNIEYQTTPSPSNPNSCN